MVWRTRNNSCTSCGCLLLLMLIVAIGILRLATASILWLVSTPLGASFVLVALVVGGLALWSMSNRLKATGYMGGTFHRTTVDSYAYTYQEPPRRALPPSPPEPSAYEILGVSSAATEEEIGEAYRKMAKLYHPDKVAHLAPEFQMVAEARMKAINAAYQQLKSDRV